MDDERTKPEQPEQHEQTAAEQPVATPAEGRPRRRLRTVSALAATALVTGVAGAGAG